MRVFFMAAIVCFGTTGVARASSIWPDLSQPAEAFGGGERDAALLVAVESYIFLPKIDGAVKNAKDWYVYLVESLKVPAPSVRLLLNKEATRESILEAAADVSGLVKAGGTVWFVFIGHGAPVDKEGALVGVDTQETAKSLMARGVKQGEVLRLLKSGNKHRTLAILDACFSGRAVGDKALMHGLQPLIIARQPTPTATDSVTVITAAGHDQYAGPLPGLDRPAFSYLMLGGLRGWAASSQKGEVSIGDAVNYSRTVLATLLTDRQQTPDLIGQTQAVVVHGHERGPILSQVVLSLHSPVDDNVGGKISEPAGQNHKPPAANHEAVPITVENTGNRGCDGGDYEECLRAAHDYAGSNGHPVDYHQAILLASKACQVNAASCVMLGIFYDYGKGVPKDLSRAEQLYKQACDGGGATGCGNLADLYEKSGIAEKDLPRAAKLYKQACDGGLFRSCGSLGLMYESGNGGGMRHRKIDLAIRNARPARHMRYV